MKKSHRVKEIIQVLSELYPDAECSLQFDNIYELTVSTILSAQCTDKRVNMVTPELFRNYPDFKSLSKAGKDDLREIIRSTGFYKNKTRNLIALGNEVTERYSGQLPDKLEELVKLPGIGRKTANCVLGNGFNITSGVVVDTHVKRLSFRMGLTDEKDPVKIEEDLKKLIPRDQWIIFPHYLILHGRSRCKARKPDCEHCRVNSLCAKRIKRTVI